ncbi:MAG TPA: hypothetical protein VHZ26_18760 [Caulobacteraceae bacterium]|jgi:hypothetical protein|nr:hypothetical protein [Caulobacteraceae bacterium]
MSSAELHALIVENMADLEESYRQFEVIDRSVFSHIDRATESWAQENEWFGTFDYYDEERLRFAPSAWLRNGDSENSLPKAWFSLGVSDDDPGEDGPRGDAFYLTRLCNVRSGMLGFQVWPEWKLFGQNAWAWKRVVRAKSAELGAVGFSIGSNGSVFRQVKIETATLAEAIRRDNLESVIEVWRQSLDHLKTTLPTIEAVLASAVA